MKGNKYERSESYWLGKKVIYRPTGEKFIVTDVCYLNTDLKGLTALRDSEGNWYSVSECRRLRPKRKNVDVLIDRLEHAIYEYRRDRIL